MKNPVCLFLFALAVMGGGVAQAADAPEAKAQVPAEVSDEKVAEPAAEKKEAPKAEEKKADAPVKEEIPKGLKEHQKAAEEVFNLTKKIAADLSSDEQKHFFLIYSNYNLIGTVKMVQDDVTKAVVSCGKENPDMKDGMDAQLKDWNGAVNPVIKESEANIENMVVAQEYAKRADIEKVFKGLDKTRTLANKQIEKTPVTTKEACTYLSDQMKDTQKKFVQLLQSTLISPPQVLPVTASPVEEKKEDSAPAKETEETKVEEKAPEPSNAEPAPEEQKE